MYQHPTKRVLTSVSADCNSHLSGQFAVGKRNTSAVSHLGVLMVIAIVSCALPGVLLAGTGGTEFNTAYTTITQWLQGDLGRLIAASLLVVGLVMGVVRQSIMAAVPAIACGLVATVAPTIIGAVVTAVI